MTDTCNHYWVDGGNGQRCVHCDRFWDGRTEEVVVRRKHRYHCSKGHVWETAQPPTIIVSPADGVEARVEGCLLCAAEMLNKSYPVVDEGEVW